MKNISIVGRNNVAIIVTEAGLATNKYNKVQGTTTAIAIAKATLKAIKQIAEKDNTNEKYTILVPDCVAKLTVKQWTPEAIKANNYKDDKRTYDKEFIDTLCAIRYYMSVCGPKVKVFTQGFKNLYQPQREITRNAWKIMDTIEKRQEKVTQLSYL
jgi:hypothetical protein